MLASFRSALLMVAALTATIIAPAQAGPAAEPLLPAASATLPKVAVPELARPAGRARSWPRRKPPDAESRRRPMTTPQPAVKPTGDLADDGRAAARPRRRQPRARMPRHRHLFRIEERAARRPAGGRQGHRQPRRQSAAAFPAPIAACCSSAANSRSSTATRCRASPHANRQWQTAVAIAKIVDQDLKESAVGDALFFHARYVSPGWRLKRVASIGNHVFYR